MSSATYNPEASFEVEAFNRTYRSSVDGDWPVRVYQPQGDGPFPVLIDVHGGAWTRGNHLNNALIDEALAASGIIVMALEFRQSPDHVYPAQVQDVNYGTRWAKTHAAEFGGDPDNVGGLGTSSGGHSMMLSALRYDEPRYNDEAVPGGEHQTAELRYAITGWPVLDSHARYLYAKDAGIARLMEPSESYFPNEAAMQEGSPQQSLDRGDYRALPPMLILQGESDDNIPLAIPERFVETFRAKGGIVNITYFPSMPHAFAQNPGPDTDKAIALMKDFLARNV
ncbi:MAG: alpha/beta hydrolase [Pseudomonadota bacterium]|nr:alpha/beta hydrolase [Pseudomonadota bacterium]|tara:strand:+ start:24 stop:869 length:846 start_codon:yes stop_codon:yes gene_type:complete